MKFILKSDVTELEFDVNAETSVKQDAMEDIGNSFDVLEDGEVICSINTEGQVMEPHRHTEYMIAMTNPNRDIYAEE